jgi:murein DD-endopeptidase MepM/ murein hydrolase activator NlpD
MGLSIRKDAECCQLAPKMIQGAEIAMTPQPRKTGFTERLMAENGLDEGVFHEWVFCPGMLFNAERAWWGRRGKRHRPHEGLDFCLYRDRLGRMHRLHEGTRIPVIYDGVVAAGFEDFVGKSIIVDHGLTDGAGGRFCTIYGHTRPNRGLRSGKRVTEGDIIGTLAPAGTGKTGVPAHLHVSMGWISEAVSYEALDWNTLGAPTAATLLDPLDFIDYPYALLVHTGAPCRNL